MTFPMWMWRAATGALGVATVGLGTAVVLQNRAIKRDAEKLSTMDSLIGNLRQENARLQKVFKELQKEEVSNAKVVALSNLIAPEQDNDKPRTA